MSDMHEATAAGIRELKALLSAALMIAQARERKRERDLREQERELVAREREVRRRDSGERGLHPQQDAQRHTGGQEAGRKDIPAAEGTPRPGPGYGQDWWEVYRATMRGGTPPRAGKSPGTAPRPIRGHGTGRASAGMFPPTSP